MSKSLTLSNGKNMPLLGLGTWLCKDDVIKNAVRTAIEIGYRHIDCAWVYRNENEIGEALSQVFKDGKIKREDIFVTSKLWNSFHRPEEVPKGLEESLKNLELEYLDLYLIHWPVSYKPGAFYPSKESMLQDMDDVDLLDTWKSMEKLVDIGKVKSIGISNFTIDQIQYILDNCRIRPTVLQVELHVHFTNKELHNFCSKNGIHITGYCSLGSPGRPAAKPGDVGPLDDPKVIEIAKKLGVTPGQVLIAYVLRRGAVCIPKSASPSRIKENFESLDIDLPKEDFEMLDNLKVNRRCIAPSIMSAHKNYPFEEKY